MFSKKYPLPLYALLLLAMVGGVFYASYGLSNTLASHHPHVAEVFFEWERKIPFIAWTILPYWSLNAFYALAFFLCKDREELHYYVKQLLLAQAIAISCFLLFPLQFSWQKPDTDGLFGLFFSSLATFDKPYNQAPSLHIILSLIVGRFYWHKLANVGSAKRLLRFVWVTWVLLIAVSVLTTYQHHFIDIPTGLLVGVLIIWAFPAPKQSVFSVYHHPDKTHRRWALFYLGISLVFILLTWGLSRYSAAWLWLLYPAISYLLVALAYAFFGVAVLQKQSHGKLSVAATVLLLPYVIGVRLNIAYWLRGKAKSHAITRPHHGTINVGSITAAKYFTHVVDMCGEYPCLAKVKHYTNIPLLDMVAPDPTLLNKAADTIEQQRGVNHSLLVCCALGYGRSVAVVLTWLVRYGGSKDLDSAIDVIQQAHPAMVLSAQTRQAIEQACQTPPAIVI